MERNNFNEKHWKKTKDEAQEYSEKNNDMIKKTVIDFD